jgi:hypothetical protein
MLNFQLKFESMTSMEGRSVFTIGPHKFPYGKFEEVIVYMVVVNCYHKYIKYQIVGSNPTLITF